MCPPGVDQTTRSSPQWCILAFGIEQTHLLTHQSPEHFLADCASLDAWQRLYRLNTLPICNVPLLPSTLLPNPRPETPPDDGTLSLASGRARAKQSRLETLPLELLSMVTSCLLEDHDTPLALALCSTYLWDHVVNQELSRYRGRGGAWAGQPLICTATWLTELAPPVLAYCPKLVEDVARWKASRDSAARSITGVASRGRGLGLRQLGMHPIRRWNWDALSRWDDAADFSPRSVLTKAFEQHSAAEVVKKNMTESTVSRLRQMLATTIDPLARCEAEDWVLRNIDTRECVSLTLFGLDSRASDNQTILPLTPDSHDHIDDGASIAATDDGYADSSNGDEDGSDTTGSDDDDNDDGRPRKRQKKLDAVPRGRFLAVPGTPWMTPDFILMSQISWCNIHTNRWLTHATLAQGPWAGHRFDIVEKGHASALPQGAHEGKAWTDASKRIIERCTSLQAEFIERGMWTGH